MKKIKNKIFAGLAFLFLVILLLSVIGIVFINQLANASKGTLADNYRSVEYSMKMLKSLDRMYDYKKNIILYGNVNSAGELNDNNYLSEKQEFLNNYYAEKKNVTEAGEKEIVNELYANYSGFIEIIEQKLNDNSSINARDSYYITRQSIVDIYNINMSAIQKINLRIGDTAKRVSYWMIIVGVLSIIITLTFIIKYPGSIVNPILELTDKIKAISKGNYDQQLKFSSRDELGDLAAAFNIMAGRLKEYEENTLDTLLVEKKRLDAVIENLQDAVFILDENKVFLMANMGALNLTGLMRDEIAGKYAPDVAMRNDLLRELIKGLVKNGSEESKDDDEKPIKIIQNKKELYYSREVIEIKTRPVGSDAERIIGYILLLKNITLFEERDVAKTNLIATVSHELKTPISSINLSLKLLEDERIGKINDEQKNLIISIRQQSVRLSKMVNELLDFSQTETGNIKLKISKVRPEDIIDLSVTAIMMLLSEKKIQINLNLSDNLPEVKADLEKTVWVLVNLITNAMRYTSENGFIDLNAEVTNEFVKFTVRDNGPGISKEDQEKIFKRFVQVGNKNKGTGLGLAISKEFVQAQGGRITVESELGNGSAFSFYLPISYNKGK
ncbi:MAG: ATP-binding protein [Ignavibacteriaceae bacterium]|nr:ATP-binding protein [Ignavibacteriaceae bacterium]